MYLRSIEVENYRAIRRACLSLDQTTVLIGENDCGRTSIIEAMMLVVGSPADNFESRLKPLHFHRRPDGGTGSLCIRLHLAEQSPGQWSLPDQLLQSFRETKAKRELVFEFRSVIRPSTAQIDSSWFVSAPGGRNRTQGDQAVLDWIRALVPALWLRSGVTGATDVPELVAYPLVADPAVASLQRHYRNLITGETPDLFGELEQAADAARVLVAKFPRAFAGAAPLMSALASDVLSRRRISDSEPQPSPNNAAGKIGIVLLVGSILQLTRRNVLPQSHPILVIENPEVNLHPATLATVWRMIERLSWQKIVATNSGTLLSNAPLGSIRRLTRLAGIVTEWSVPPRLLSRDDLRRVSYHVRSRRASAMFARCWLLVEGETEFWVLPELGRICGFDFAAEGIVCVEFAQCGVVPLIRLADRLGIGWHVLVDGDDAGQKYAEAVRKAARFRQAPQGTSRLTLLRDRDIEHCFWHNGFSDVITQIACGIEAPRSGSASASIRRAIDKASKPYLALSLIDAAGERGPGSVPTVLENVIHACIKLARSQS